MREEFLERIPDDIMNIIFRYIKPSIKYSLTKDDALRITFDNSINFSRVINIRNNFKIQKRFPYNLSVIELKYDANYLPSNKFLSNLFDRFNLTFSKFSKYCIAIDSIY